MTRAQRKNHLVNVAARITAKALRYEDLAQTAVTAKQRRRWAHLAQTRRNRVTQINAQRNAL